MSLLIARGWTRQSLKVPSNPKYFMILLNYYLYSQAHTRHFPRHAKHLQGFLLQGTWHMSWKQSLLMLVNLAQYLVYVFTICSQSACRSSMALYNLYCPSSFPKGVYYLLNFKVCSLSPGTLLSSASQDPSVPDKLFRTFLSSNLQFCVLGLRCLPALFHYHHLTFEHSHQLSNRVI